MKENTCLESKMTKLSTPLERLRNGTPHLCPVATSFEKQSLELNWFHMYSDVTKAMAISTD